MQEQCITFRTAGIGVRTRMRLAPLRRQGKPLSTHGIGCVGNLLHAESAIDHSAHILEMVYCPHPPEAVP